MPDKGLLRLDRPAQAVAVRPGGEIILRGAFVSKNDGSIVDAATTTWPKDAPGGASVDPGGLVDFAGGGFHVTSRDPVTHEVHAIALGGEAPACAAFGVTSPCLPLRVLPQARSRLLTVEQWASSLQGGVEIEVVAPPPPTPVADAAASAAPYLVGGLTLVVVVAGVTVGLWLRRRRAASAVGQLHALATRLRDKLTRADPVVAAPLAPAIDAAMRAVHARRVDPGSVEGQRVMTLLRRVDTRLDDVAREARAAEEQQAADELVHEVESALEAADEASRLTGRIRGVAPGTRR